MHSGRPPDEEVLLLRASDRTLRGPVSARPRRRCDDVAALKLRIRRPRRRPASRLRVGSGSGGGRNRPRCADHLSRRVAEDRLRRRASPMNCPWPRVEDLAVGPPEWVEARSQTVPPPLVVSRPRRAAPSRRGVEGRRVRRPALLPRPPQQGVAAGDAVAAHDPASAWQRFDMGREPAQWVIAAAPVA